MDFFSDGNKVKNVLAYSWSIFTFMYIITVTLVKIPAENIRIVDTVLGVLLGTIIGGVISYYFGSSQSSHEKNKLITETKTGAQ